MLTSQIFDSLRTVPLSAERRAALDARAYCAAGLLSKEGQEIIVFYWEPTEEVLYPANDFALLPDGEIVEIDDTHWYFRGKLSMERVDGKPPIEAKAVKDDVHLDDAFDLERIIKLVEIQAKKI